MKVSISTSFNGAFLLLDAWYFLLSSFCSILWSLLNGPHPVTGSFNVNGSKNLTHSKNDSPNLKISNIISSVQITPNSPNFSSTKLLSFNGIIL